MKILAVVLMLGGWLQGQVTEGHTLVSGTAIVTVTISQPNNTVDCSSVLDWKGHKRVFKDIFPNECVATVLVTYNTEIVRVGDCFVVNSMYSLDKTECSKHAEHLSNEQTPKP